MTKIEKILKAYHSERANSENCIMLFHIGNYYELFEDDAKTAGKLLGLTLSHRQIGGEQVTIAGFPIFWKGDYIDRLVKAGFRVAVIEEVQS